jgi:ubiquinone/menaquinone biosynthesis C-methylase UbiE
MGLIEKCLQQFKIPQGYIGKLTGMNMNFGHGRLYRWCISLSPIKKNSVILDIGCGGGRFINILSKYVPEGKIYGIDYSNTMVNLAKKLNQNLVNEGRVEIKNGTVSSLPFSDDMFNLVTGIETCYFWPHLIYDLKEIKRVLKPKGTFILTNELHLHENINPLSLKFANLARLPLFTPKQLKESFIKAGFSNIEINKKNSLLSVKGKYIL